MGYDECRSCKQYVPVWNIAVSSRVKPAEEGEEEDPLHVFFFFVFFVFFIYIYIEAMQTHKQHEANSLIAEREDSETQNGV